MIVALIRREVINMFTFAELEIIQNALKASLSTIQDNTVQENTQSLISKIDGMYLNKEVF